MIVLIDNTIKMMVKVFKMYNLIDQIKTLLFKVDPMVQKWINIIFIVVKMTLIIMILILTYFNQLLRNMMLKSKLV